MNENEYVSAIIMSKNMERTGRVPGWAMALGMVSMVPQVAGVRNLTTLALEFWLHRRMRELGVKCVSRELVTVPLRGIDLYCHRFVHGERSFSCCELSQGLGSASAAALANSIMEREVREGCLNCGFGTKLEEDQVCEICRGSVLRSFIVKQGYPRFGDSGWPVLKEILGPKDSSMLAAIGAFAHVFNTNKDVKEGAQHLFDEPDELHDMIEADRWTDSDFTWASMVIDFDFQGEGDEDEDDDDLDEDDDEDEIS